MQKINSNLTVFCQAGFWLLALITFAVCLMPSSGHSQIPHFDKIIHALNYALLGTLASFGFRKLPYFSMLFIVLFVFGALIEVLQSFTGYRTFSLLDMAANGAGLLLASITRYRAH